MQKFLTLTLLISSALAFPGYGYHAPHQRALTAELQPLQQVQHLQPLQQLHQLQQLQPLQHLHYQQQVAQQFIEPVVEISKQYHVYSAPEEEYHEQLSQNFLTLKKNLRVLFIKAPENNAITTAINQLAKQVTEDKTAIYVLSKQHDLNEVAHKIQEIKEVHTHKPEVHFIKYKTPEEAELAKSNIQSVYDALGGTSEITHDGVVPVHDYSGSIPTVPTLPAVSLPIVSTVSSGSASSISPGGYLPPAKH